MNAVSEHSKQLIGGGVQSAISIAAIIAIVRSAIFLRRESRKAVAHRIRAVRRNAKSNANSDLDKHLIWDLEIILSDADRDLFLAELANPRPPNWKIIEAAREYRFARFKELLKSSI